MRGAMNMLNIKAQLLIAAILVSATGAWSAETADQAAPVAATEIAVPKADASKKPDARKPQRVDTADHASATVAPPAAVELAVSKTDVSKTDAARKSEAKKPHVASGWRCGWGFLSWFNSSCSSSSGRVGLVLGTAY